MSPKLRSQSVKYHFGLGLLSLFATSSIAATICVNPHGIFGCKSTISAAVAAASPGDTIQVAQGIHKEQVVISKALSLISAPGSQPVIDPTGLGNGIFVNGLSTVPNPGVANLLISGFKVKNANFEGILVVRAAPTTPFSTIMSSTTISRSISRPANVRAFPHLRPTRVTIAERELTSWPRIIPQW